MKKEKGDFFNFKFFKRGLSTVVITLILILLSLVAIGVLWVVIGGILNSASDKIGFDQFTISLDITNAYEQDGEIIVNLKRNVGGGELVKIRFILSDGENTESYTSNISLGELESKRYEIPVLHFVSTSVTTVSVAPIFKSSDGKETLGSILDTYKISESRTEIPVIPSGDDNPGGGSCTPDCTNLECGPDPICGYSCGSCNSSSSCINGVCVIGSCVPEPVETTCAFAVCGTKVNNCGEIIECGVCPFGKICKNNLCEDVIIVNSGIVEDLWPGDSGMYFGSSSLPTTESYAGYYAKFPGSVETSCLLIVVYRFPIEGYPKSHVGFSFATSLQVGDTYNIYQSIDGCSM
jgi:hypothetical protein